MSSTRGTRESAGETVQIEGEGPVRESVAAEGRGPWVHRALVVALGVLACAGAVGLAIVTRLGVLFLLPLAAAWVLFPGRGRERLRSPERTGGDGRGASAPDTLAGTVRLVFVESDSQTLTLDGMLVPRTPVGAGGPSPVRTVQPCWLRLRQPAPLWMRASLETVVQRWVDEGRAIQLSTRQTPVGPQVVLDSGSSHLILDVEDVGGIAA
jgi:hypothetical protein